METKPNKTSKVTTYLSLFSAFVFSSSVFIFNKNDNLHTYAILCHMSWHRFVVPVTKSNNIYIYCIYVIIIWYQRIRQQRRLSFSYMYIVFRLVFGPWCRLYILTDGNNYPTVGSVWKQNSCQFHDKTIEKQLRELHTRIHTHIPLLNNPTNRAFVQLNFHYVSFHLNI